MAATLEDFFEYSNTRLVICVRMAGSRASAGTSPQRRDPWCSTCFGFGLPQLLSFECISGGVSSHQVVSRMIAPINVHDCYWLLHKVKGWTVPGCHQPQPVLLLQLWLV